MHIGYVYAGRMSVWAGMNVRLHQLVCIFYVFVFVCVFVSVFVVVMCQWWDVLCVCVWWVFFMGGGGGVSCLS